MAEPKDIAKRLKVPEGKATDLMKLARKHAETYKPPKGKTNRRSN